MTIVTREEIQRHVLGGPWTVLERLALEMVADAQSRAGRSVMGPLLGGGTRLMLALGHRLSDDIDLFIRDPQWIGYLTLRMNDTFEDRFTKYEEAADFIKFKHAVGEIDFIVRGSLLGLPPEVDTRSQFLLEPVAEVLAKKLFYRGDRLTVRDLFDWRSIETHPFRFVPDGALPSLIDPTRREGLLNALDRLLQSPVQAGIWKAIRTPNNFDLAETVRWAKDAVFSWGDGQVGPSRSAPSAVREGFGPG